MIKIKEVKFESDIPLYIQIRNYIREKITNNEFKMGDKIPYLLVPVVSFGKLLGIQAPIIECIIRLASAINGIDYLKTGRNLETLGLSGMSLEKILSCI